MATIATEESEILLKDGTKLYAKEWKTIDAPVASIIFLHGFSDHCNAYFDFFPELARRGINVYSFDQRGWGKSAIEKKYWGVTGGTQAIFTDLDQVISSRLSHCQTQPSQPPLFLVGHSAGGGLTLTYAYSGSLRSKLAGYVVYSPFVKIAAAEQPNPIVLFVGRLASKILPNMQKLNEFDANNVSRDPAVCKSFAEDKLCHNTGTLIGFAEMLERGERLLQKEYVKKFDKKKPLLVLHGTGDKVTDFASTKKFYGLLDAEKIQSAQFKEYDGWSHKMHADLPENRHEFATDVADWIVKQANNVKKSEVPTAHL